VIITVNRFNIKQQIIYNGIDQNILLDELSFDPPFDDDLYKKPRFFIKQGFTKTLGKSKLYHIPNFNLRLNHY